MSGVPWLRREVIGGQTLYLGDCHEIMPQLRFDAIVSDPPYGIGYVQGEGHNANKSKFIGQAILGDDQPFDPAPFMAGPCLLWGCNHFASRLPDTGRWLVWDKRDGMGTFSQSDCEFAWVSGPKRADRLFRHMWTGFAKASEKGVARVHPTQKPVPVMEWCLTFLPDAKTILDPFIGSGTTLVACQRMGRRGIGIELDPSHFATACRRVEDAARQPDLLIAAHPQPPSDEMPSLL